MLVLALVAGAVAVRSRTQAEESRVAAEAKRIAASALNEERRDLALLAAVEAVQMEAGPETHGALLTLLSRAPEIVTSHRTANRFLRLAVTGDGDTVVAAENEPVVRGLDAVTGDQRWQPRLRGDRRSAASPHHPRVIRSSRSPSAPPPPG